MGGNIALAGFGDRDFTEMIVVKKMVGQYARKLSDNFKDFSGLKLTLKSVHGSKAEIHAHATISGKELVSKETASNIYVALDSCLKSVLAQAKKIQEKN